MMKRLFIFAGLIAAAMLCTAQRTTVTGTAPGAEGKIIYVKTYDDFISYRVSTLAATEVDSAGNFTMDIPLGETKYAWFSIEYYKGEMYLQPQYTHRFDLGGLKFTHQTDMLNTNLEPLAMNVKVDATDTLNVSIQRLNVFCNTFLLAHLSDFRTRRMAFYMDSLRTALDSVFSGISNDYFRQYKTFRLASMELTNGLNTTDGLMEQYILHQNVLSGHIEYIDFLFSFFSTYFDEVNRSVTRDIIRHIVNTENSYPALLDSLANDYYLHSEELREAVSLILLNDLYGLKGYKRDNVIAMMRQAAETCGYRAHREMAANMVYMLTRNNAGSPATDFSLTDHEGKKIKLEAFRGKFVYLCFFTTWNIVALNELELLRSLAPKYGLSVEFLGICCDREYMKMYHFAREKQYPWKLLHFGNDYELLEQFGVKTYPHFVLIDRQGRYLSNPAPAPSRNIEATLLELIQKTGNE